MNFSTHLSVFNVICCYLYLFNILKIVSIFLSTQPQINTSVYPTIKISLFAAPKTQKIRGPGFTSKSSEKPYISSIFTLSIMYFSQQNHALNMYGIRKHVHRLYFLQLIPCIHQHSHISCQSCRIAADIHNALWCHLDHGI